MSQLESQRLQTAQLFAASTERDGNFRYAPDKWTIKEVVGHLSDTERIFTYRALRIARGDQTPLQGFEQDDYVKNGNFAEQSLADLVAEFGGGSRSHAGAFSIIQRRGVGSPRHREQQSDHRASFGVHHRRSRVAPSRDSERALLPRHSARLTRGTGAQIKRKHTHSIKRARVHDRCSCGDTAVGHDDSRHEQPAATPAPHPSCASPFEPHATSGRSHPCDGGLRCETVLPTS